MSITIGKVKILKIKFNHSRHFGHVYDFTLAEIPDFEIFFFPKWHPKLRGSGGRKCYLRQPLWRWGPLKWRPATESEAWQSKVTPGNWKWVRASRLELGRGAASTNKKIEGYLGKEVPENGGSLRPAPSTFAPFVFCGPHCTQRSKGLRPNPGSDRAAPFRFH